MELLKQMIKSNFNILICEEGTKENHALKVNGYILKYRDLYFGVNIDNPTNTKYKKWIITELQTGCKCADTRLLKNITSEFLDSFYNNVCAVIEHSKKDYLKNKYNNISYFNYFSIIAQNTSIIEKLENMAN